MIPPVALFRGAGGGGGPPAFDPATAPLTLWVKPDYAAPSMSPRWPGTASAGSSAAHPLEQNTDADAIPTVGSAVNGHDPADFGGSAGLETPDTLDDFFGVGAPTGKAIVLVRPRNGVATSGSAYSDPCVLSDGTSFYVSYSSSGFGGYLFDGVVGGAPLGPVAATEDDWHAVALSWDGATAGLSVDSAPVSTFAWAGSPDGGGSTIEFGKNPFVAFGDFELLEAMAVEDPADIDTADAIAYFNLEYLLSL